jgi:hypothetical protein
VEKRRRTTTEETIININKKRWPTIASRKGERLLLLILITSGSKGSNRNRRRASIERPIINSNKQRQPMVASKKASQISIGEEWESSFGKIQDEGMKFRARYRSGKSDSWLESKQRIGHQLWLIRQAPNRSRSRTNKGRYGSKMA